MKNLNYLRTSRGDIYIRDSVEFGDVHFSFGRIHKTSVNMHIRYDEKHVTNKDDWWRYEFSSRQICT